MSSLPKQVIGIVGAGFSGSILAINLLQEEGVSVRVIERDAERVAKGVAYGTRDPEHLLNVRATNMSAFPDDPTHFLRWMGFEKEDEKNQFVQRKVYGAYIRELLEAALSEDPENIALVRAEAIGARRNGERMEIILSNGSSVDCDILVLAQGNLSPAALPAFDHLDPDFYRKDPWSHALADGLADDDHVLVVGTGLTAIDAILMLDSAGFRGRITALSRRGLRPHRHDPIGPLVLSSGRPPVDGSWLIRHVRQRAQKVGWRLAVDELRPHTQDLWRRFGPERQKRFLRHLRPYWDIHRHRLAPDVADRIDQIANEGRLEFVAGKISACHDEEGRRLVDWRPRGDTRNRTMTVRRIINCTGPQGSIAREDDPLLVDLRAQGLIRPDPLDLGIDVDGYSRAKDDCGKPQDDIFALGPIARGEAWEVIAVPDLRRQVWDVARRISNAHWVGGEGL